MATNFPTGLDNLPKPNPTDPLTAPSHAKAHTDTADAIHALQSKVGVNGSTDTASLTYQLTQKAASNHTHTGYAPLAHQHSMADVNGLQTILDGKQDKGAGILSDAMRIRGTFDVTVATTDTFIHGDVVLASKSGAFAWRPVSSIMPATVNAGESFVFGTDDAWHALGDLTDLSGKADVVHQHTIAEVTGLQAALDTEKARVDAVVLQLAGFTLAQVSALPATPNAKTIYFIV